MSITLSPLNQGSLVLSPADVTRLIDRLDHLEQSMNEMFTESRESAKVIREAFDAQNHALRARNQALGAVLKNVDAMGPKINEIDASLTATRDQLVILDNGIEENHQYHQRMNRLVAAWLSRCFRHLWVAEMMPIGHGTHPKRLMIEAGPHSSRREEVIPLISAADASQETQAPSLGKIASIMSRVWWILGCMRIRGRSPLERNVSYLDKADVSRPFSTGEVAGETKSMDSFNKTTYLIGGIFIGFAIGFVVGSALYKSRF